MPIAEKLLKRIKENDRKLTKIELRNAGLVDDDITKLIEALANNKTVVSIDISYNDEISPAKIKALAECLAQLPALRRLYMSHNLVGDEGAKAVSAISQLKGLDMSGNNIGNKGLEALAALKKLTFLNVSARYIPFTNVTSNKITAEGAKALAKLLHANEKLESLDISCHSLGVGIQDEELQEALKTHKVLSKLDISNNLLENSGVIVLVNTLATTSTLTWLRIKGNNVTDQGAEALAKTLPNLRRLNISKNQLSAAGAKALTALKYLLALGISHNNIGDKGVEALGAFEYLTVLDVAHNQITDTGVEALIIQLAVYQKLIWLCMKHNKIENAAVKILKELKNLSELNLSYNLIKATEKEMLIAQLNSHQMLAELNMEGNDIATASGLKLWQVLAEQKTRRRKVFFINLLILADDWYEENPAKKTSLWCQLPRDIIVHKIFKNMDEEFAASIGKSPRQIYEFVNFIFDKSNIEKMKNIKNKPIKIEEISFYSKKEKRIKIKFWFYKEKPSIPKVEICNTPPVSLKLTNK